MVKQLGGWINIPLEWAQQEEEAHSYATLAGRKERRERKVSVCVAHVPVRARDHYAIARESADRKHENKTRPTVGGGFTPLYLEVKDARECRDTSCTTLAPDTPLERIWNAHCGIAFGLDAPLFSSPCDPLHLATSPLLPSVPFGRKEHGWCTMIISL